MNRLKRQYTHQQDMPMEAEATNFDSLTPQRPMREKSESNPGNSMFASAAAGITNAFRRRRGSGFGLGSLFKSDAKKQEQDQKAEQDSPDRIIGVPYADPQSVESMPAEPVAAESMPLEPMAAVSMPDRPMSDASMPADSMPIESMSADSMPADSAFATDEALSAFVPEQDRTIFQRPAAEEPIPEDAFDFSFEKVREEESLQGSAGFLQENLAEPETQTNPQPEKVQNEPTQKYGKSLPLYSDFYHTIEKLEALAQQGKRNPMTGKLSADAEQMLHLSGALRQQLPKLVDQAQEVLSQREVLLQTAQQIADSAELEAQTQKAKMEKEFNFRISQLDNALQQKADEKMTSAQQEADDTIARAKQEAEARINGASRQAEDIVANAERRAQSIVAEAHRKGENIVGDADQKLGESIANANQQADEIVKQASQQAKIIVENAERRAHQLVSEDEITARANLEAEDLQTRTQQSLTELYDSVYNHLDYMLSEVDKSYSSQLNVIRNMHEKIMQNLQ